MNRLAVLGLLCLSGCSAEHLVALDLRTDLVYRLRIVVDNPDEALRQGQPVTVTIPAARPAAED